MSRRKRVENATRAWGQRCSKSIALAVSVSLGFSCVQINAEGLLGVSETLAGPCASDSDVTGFSSLVQLNSEMRRHALLISLPDHEPLPEYTYRLCPQSVFDGSQQIQVPPQLFPYDPTIKCGNSGDAAESCNINGGVTQVFMMDSAGSALDADSATSREPTTGSFSFEGLTFTNSQDLSIAAMMSSPLAIAQFTDCHWKNPQGTAGIFVANYEALAEARIDVETVLEDEDNIFRPHRLLREPRVETSISIAALLESRSLTSAEQGSSSRKAGMTVLLSSCSFEHSFIIEQTSQMQDFILLDIHGGRVELKDSTISTGGGILVVNAVNGGTFKALNTAITSSLPADFSPNTVNGDGWKAIATLRSQGSQILLVKSTIMTDYHAITTLAAVDQSEVLVSDSQFVHIPSQLRSSRQLQQPLSQILVVGSSKATITDSCFEGAETTTGSTVVVDSSSILEQENNGVSASSTSDFVESAASSEMNSSSELPFVCAQNSDQNDIWILDTSWTCLEGTMAGMDAVGGNLRTSEERETFTLEGRSNTCSGTCQAMARRSQCIAAASQSNRTSGGSAHSTKLGLLLASVLVSFSAMV